MVRLKEYIEKNNLEKVKDYIHQPRHVNKVLSVLKLKGQENYKKLYEVHHTFNEIPYVIIEPNFYEDGWIIGRKKNKVLMASGQVKCIFRNKTYNSMYFLFQDHGNEVFEKWDEIEWLEVKSWILAEDNMLIREIDNLMGEI